MENPLYSGQSIAVSRWVVGTVLLAVCQGVFFFFFLSIGASCLGTGVILWPPPLLLFFYPPPFSLKLHN